MKASSQQVSVLMCAGHVPVDSVQRFPTTFLTPPLLLLVDPVVAGRIVNLNRGAQRLLALSNHVLETLVKRRDADIGVAFLHLAAGGELLGLGVEAGAVDFAGRMRLAGVAAARRGRRGTVGAAMGAGAGDGTAASAAVAGTTNAAAGLGARVGVCLGG
ncbi:hypothetical protein HC256_001109 [Beauveria bassiana]|nr:hypothetical protein HC256_001109 [Beauveria bassiana]